ncbi:MAG: hypothetical protein HW384_284 [Dehalococcoidia bacterium]|nr:hypothetical protein [Dehalococcoidia bacterium]
MNTGNAAISRLVPMYLEDRDKESDGTTTFAVEVTGVVTLLIPLALIFWWSGMKKLE